MVFLQSAYEIWKKMNMKNPERPPWRTASVADFTAFNEAVGKVILQKKHASKCVFYSGFMA
jgi:hypothetical protein